MRAARPYTRFAALALVVAAGGSCGTRSDSTSLIVQVDSDLIVGTEIDAIAVNGHSIRLASSADLPVVLAFTPSGASDEPIAVTAIARWHGADVVEQSVTTSFQPGKATFLVMRLDRFCEGIACDASQTCETGICGPKSRTPGPYTGTKDASVPDAPWDNTPRSDGSTPDGPRDGTAQTDSSDDHFVDTARGDSGPVDTAPAMDASITNDAGDGSSPDVATAICGDGAKDLGTGETCDYLGGADHADCNGVAAPALLRCRDPICGDGYINRAAGETCDTTGGTDRADCNGLAAGPNLSCKASLCGDGYINGAAGETCDDGNQSSGDGCSSPTCQIETGFVCPTPGQTCHSTCGDGKTLGSEVCDDFNASACGTCSATCSALQTPTPAMGSITAVSAALLVNGETFTISDGIHIPVVFEFNDNTPIDTTHVQVLRGSSTSNSIAAKIAAAINGVGAALAINAQVNSSLKNQVFLTNGSSGAAGNVTLNETVANTSFVVVGMSGGLGFDCPAATGCGGNDDCQSGVCCLGMPGTAACPCPISGGSCPSFARNTCLAPSCNDAVINGTETDADCGGGSCSKCMPGQTCLVASDCTSGVCTQSICAAPSCTDHVFNGTETDVDCGSSCPTCANGLKCNSNADCQGGFCCGTNLPGCTPNTCATITN